MRVAAPKGAANRASNVSVCSLRKMMALPAHRAPQRRGAFPPLLLPRSVGGAGGPVTDAAVPEGHRSLHTALYGDAGDAAAAHGAAAYRPVAGEDDGADLVATGPYLEARDGAKPPGVFALYDESKTLQYVGYSRNIVLSIRTLQSRVGLDRTAFVRAQVVANQAMQTREALQRQAQAWLDEAGVNPPGNGDEADLWGASAADAPSMTPAELAAYRDRKLKLQAAMGEGGLGKGPESADDRRRKMVAAVEGGDWSEVIDEQTRATLAAGGVLASVVAAGAVEDAGGKGAPASPFTQAGVHRQVGESSSKSSSLPAMTVETVNAALVEVRPYLQADGGDLEVVGVEGGIVALRLEGACSTCASSSATLKMGVERALKATFGEAFKGLVQVDKADDTPTVRGVDDHLATVRPAIMAMGGAVEVASVDGGVVVLRYRGPPPLAKGLIAAVRDRYPRVADVQVVGFE